jgi:hypothetical protein
VVGINEFQQTAMTPTEMVEHEMRIGAAVDARMSAQPMETCAYPNCKCPWDAPDSESCFKGLRQPAPAAVKESLTTEPTALEVQMARLLETFTEWARQVADQSDVRQGIRSAAAKLHDDGKRQLAAFTAAYPGRVG